MKLYLLKPYDVLTFGGLKHFTAGETHIQKSTFPPPIMRFFNVFRSVYGVFLFKENELYMPVPADCLIKRKEKEKKNVEVKIAPSTDVPPLLKGSIEAYETATGFISFKDFKEKYAGGKSGKADISPLNDFLKWEQRVGIALEKKKRTAKEGMLYSQDFLRLKDGVRIAVLGEIHKDSEQREFLRIGGEKRICFYKEFKEPDPFLKEKLNVRKGGTYKFYCLTHTYISGGIKFGESKTLNINGLEFEIIWLFNGGVEYVSGYKKPFLEMIKPGTVIVLKAKEDVEISRLCQIHTDLPVNSIDRESFLKKGWNSGILLEVKGHDRK